MLSLAAGVVSDINQVGGGPTNLTPVGDKLFFLTPTSSAGSETLWESGAGTSGGVALGSITAPNAGLPSNSPPFVAQNGTVYFIGSDTTTGQGLFKTDGTRAGTTEVVPLSDPDGSLAVAGGKVFFSETGPSGLELWESDGTSGGTTEVTAFAPSSYMIDMIGLGNSVYFTIETTGSDWSGTPQLWTSGGTGSGTIELTNFSAGSGLSDLTVLGGKIVFVGNDGTNGDELWATDGTPAGTTQLTDFQDLSVASSIGSSDPLQVANGAIYFALWDGTTGAGQVWTSDGSANGTVPVATAGGVLDVAGDFTAVGNTVYFVAESLSESSTTPTLELWADRAGTAAPVAPNVSWVSGPTALTSLNDKALLFAADDGSGDGEELWKSDGTASGTTMLGDINPGSGGSLSYNNDYTPAVANGDSPNAITVMNGVAYFIANDGSDGQELWKSDGTAQGTAMVNDIAPGSTTSLLQSLTDVDGALYFVASEGPGSNQLWMSNGTAGGTSLVQNFAQAQNAGSYPQVLGVVDGSLYFAADDGIDGQQLWRTDETATGATMVTDLPVGSGGYNGYGGWGFPAFSSVVGSAGSIDFESTKTTANVPTVFESDGTPAGTTPIFTPDSSAVGMSGLTMSGNSLYFLTGESNDSGTNLDLWKSDGTASGTSLVTSIPHSYGYDRYSLTDVNGKLFFSVPTGSSATGYTAYQLWSSDGTAAGTSEVTSLSGQIEQAVALGNELIFTEADSTGSTDSLWASDGTAAGTVQLQDFSPSGGYGQGPGSPISGYGPGSGSPINGYGPGSGSPISGYGPGSGSPISGYGPGTGSPIGGYGPGAGNSISGLTVAGGTAYFVGENGAETQLWSTDGTVAGTMPLMTASTGADGVAPSDLVAMNGTLYFLASDPSNTEQALWSSDGTSGGTTVITDLGGGNSYYGIDQLFASNNTLFILGNDQPSSNGPDLWESDGTPAGTTDLGSLPQFPSYPTPDGTTFFFAANDARGNELWYAQSRSTPSPNPGSNPNSGSNPTGTPPSTSPAGPPSGSNSGSTSDSSGTTTSGSTGTSTSGSTDAPTAGSTGTTTTGSTGTSTSDSNSTGTSGSGSSSTSGSNSTSESSSNSTPKSSSNSTPTAVSSSSPKTTDSTATQTATAAPVQPPAPTIIGERAIFRRKMTRRGKPVGKPVLTGFAIDFSRPMGATALSSAFYQLENVRAKAHGKNSATHMSAVGITVSYDASSNTATVQLAGKQSFPNGGILMVSPSVASAAGASLAGTSTFAVGAGGKTINPA